MLQQNFFAFINLNKDHSVHFKKEAEKKIIDS